MKVDTSDYPTISSSGGNEGITFPGDASVYRWSSMGALVVSYDAYRYTPARYANLISIGCITILGILFIAWLRYRSLKSNQSSYVLNALDRHRLSCVAMVALAANGIHFIDNFARMEIYHLPRWIYIGWIVPLDSSCLYWHISAALCLLSCAILLSPCHIQNQANVLVAANGRGVRYWLQQLGLLASSTPLQRNWLARYAMYIHCIMIWTGQGHYLFEPPSMFETSANLSIWFEGSTAIILHIYTVYLAKRMIDNCTMGMNGNGNAATSTSGTSVELSSVNNDGNTTTDSSSSTSTTTSTSGHVESAPLIDPASLSSSDVLMRRRSRSGGMAPDHL